MIIKWNEARVKVIPTNSGKTIILLPGHNEVSKVSWEGARPNVVGDIASKRIEEIGVEIDSEDKKGPGGKPSGEVKITIKEAKALKDLTPEKAEAIVQETYSLDTLKKWKKVESRDSVRAVIADQMDNVNHQGSSKEK
jgi:hypothetical protein